MKKDKTDKLSSFIMLAISILIGALVTSISSCRTEKDIAYSRFQIKNLENGDVFYVYRYYPAFNVGDTLDMDLTTLKEGRNSNSAKVLVVKGY